MLVLFTTPLPGCAFRILEVVVRGRDFDLELELRVGRGRLRRDLSMLRVRSDAAAARRAAREWRDEGESKGEKKGAEGLV